jgi:transposase
MNEVSELFEHLLNFGDEWKVTNIAVDDAHRQVEVHVKYTASTAKHPETGDLLPIYDHRHPRRWRHLNIMQYQTWIVCSLPRVKNAAGKVTTVAAPWAEANQRCTFWFEALAIEVAQLTKSPTKTAVFLQSSYDVITGILDRAVARGIERRNEQDHSVRTLSLDEKAFRRGHDYITIVSCPQTGQVYDVGMGRKQSDAQELLEAVDRQIGLDQVEAVSMDMWKAYINSVESSLPQARIVHDKFHVIAWLNKAVDQVRRAEAKSKPELKNTRYLWLKNQQNHSDKQAENFKRISQLNLVTAQAWRSKENFKALYEQNSPIEGYHYFCQWFEDVASKGITACKKVAQMCQTHLLGILNYINYPITNSRAEQVNSKIQQLKSISKGYRNFGNFRTAILFYFGKLDLYPQGFP